MGTRDHIASALSALTENTATCMDGPSVPRSNAHSFRTLPRCHAYRGPLVRFDYANLHAGARIFRTPVRHALFAAAAALDSDCSSAARRRPLPVLAWFRRSLSGLSRKRRKVQTRG